MDKFSNIVAESIGYYVYRMIDPRNGETFYVGKGKGNRIFHHLHLVQNLEEGSIGNKDQRIRSIRLARMEPVLIIHRHGLTEIEALEVEAALIDAYPGLTNIQGGVGNNDYGCMGIAEVVAKYETEPAIFKHKVLMININRSSEEADTLTASRYAWRLKAEKASRADYVLAVRYGVIVDCFVATQWLPATKKNFPGFPVVQDGSGRYGFKGKAAPRAIKEQYVGKSVPEKFRKKGAANPIRYSYK